MLYINSQDHLALARSPIVIFLSKTNMEQSVANMARYELSGGHIATHIGTNEPVTRATHGLACYSLSMFHIPIAFFKKLQLVYEKLPHISNRPWAARRW
jgi:hypothetical protein